MQEIESNRLKAVNMLAKLRDDYNLSDHKMLDHLINNYLSGDEAVRAMLDIAEEHDIDEFDGTPDETESDEDGTQYVCLECGWHGTNARTEMIDNPNNSDDKTLYETKVCPDCGEFLMNN